MIDHTVLTAETGADTGGAPAGGPRRRWMVATAIAVVVAVAIALVVVLVTRDGDDESATRATTTTEQPATTPSSAPQDTDGDQTPPPPGSQTSAADALAPFFSAAETMDGQLRAAAAAINAAGPPWETVSDEVAAAVRAADIEAVEATIPAGLPTDLLQSVILVHSDLSSRRAAMESFAAARTAGEPLERDLVAELGNGHAAAERFDGDLATARELAGSLPAVAVAPADSRPAAELALILRYVHTANRGCDSRGGYVATELPPVEWSTDASGTIGQEAIEFTAALGSDGRWDVNILAC